MEGLTLGQLTIAYGEFRGSSSLRALRAILLVTFLPALLSACGRPGAEDPLIPVATQAPGSTDHTILIATTRKRSADPGELFSGERAGELDYAQAVVSVPPTHVPAHIEWPSQKPGNPQTDFVTREANYLDGDKEFIASLNQQLAQRPPGKRNVLLFIHGYNTLFPEGLYRLAQVAHDSRMQGVPVHFSWASRGQLTGYVYDNNSATSARDGLERTLRLIAASNVEHVNVLAHSMGNWVTVEAFRNIRIAGGAPMASKLGMVALASPDIDVDVFRSQMKRIGVPKKPFLIILSRDDRALALSRFIAGGDKDRLGDYKNAADLTKFGAVVVDLSDLKSNDPINHDKFAEIATVAPQLQEVLAQGVGKASPAEDVIPVQDGPGVVQTALTLPLAAVAAPIVIIARQAQ
jgi:esterase/lipase superfamily enzyme